MYHLGPIQLYGQNQHIDLVVQQNYPQPVQPPPLTLANDTQSIPWSAPPFSYSPETFDMETMSQIPTMTDPSAPLLSVTQYDGRPRYCEHCQRIKPDRAHHCRECDSCTLKMDQYVYIVVHLPPLQ